MASYKRSGRAGEAAKSVASNPYVRRLIEDEDLRQNIKAAYESARDAYGRMSNGKGPAKALMDDKKVHNDLRSAAESLKSATDQIRNGSGPARARRKGRSFGRILLAGALGGIAVLIASEEARKAVLDRLFGAEEEFEYTSATAPAPDSVTTT